MAPVVPSNPQKADPEYSNPAEAQENNLNSLYDYDRVP